MIIIGIYCLLYQSIISQVLFWESLLSKEKKSQWTINRERKREARLPWAVLEKYFSHGGDWILTRQPSSILHCTVSVYRSILLFFPLLQHISESHLLLSLIHRQTSLGYPPSIECKRAFLTGLPYQIAFLVKMHLASIYRLKQGSWRLLIFKLLSLQAFNRRHTQRT